MGREPFQGEPVAGALGAARGLLDQVWELPFDVAGWPAEPRYVLYYLPPNLRRPTEVIWVGVGRAR
jgi:hypothetical protein